MCKFTYIGYYACEEPERHYLIRREKCTAKAHLKHWCGPNEQEEAPLLPEQVSLPCPMCADVPVVYDQPLLEIAHSRRSVLPAPHYDAVTGMYSRLGRHYVQPSASMMPKPLNMGRMHYDRSASESAVNRIKQTEVSPDYTLPAATYMPTSQTSNGNHYSPPAAAYLQGSNNKLPKPFPMPQGGTLTPPSSREASLSPPQNRIAGGVIPPGESNRRELESLNNRARARTPVRPAPTDRSRSGSESSSASSSNASASRTPPPPPPPRKPSNASSTSSSSFSTQQRPPQHTRKDSESSNADRFATAALRTLGIDRTASPERGRRPQRRERGGSSSERSDSPGVVWRPTISPPRLQQDSLGMGGAGAEAVMMTGERSFKQRLVPFAPSSKTTQGAEEQQRPATRARTPLGGKMAGLRLFPHRPDDEKVATPASTVYGTTMLREEEKALISSAQRTSPKQQQQVKRAVIIQAPDEETLTAVDMQSVQDMTRSGGDPYNLAGVGATKRDASKNATNKDKVLPSAPPQLRRIITAGQAKTVTVAPPRPPRRANTAAELGETVKVKTGGPLFSFAGVGGGSRAAQEFEIVSGGPDGAGITAGRAF